MSHADPEIGFLSQVGQVKHESRHRPCARCTRTSQWRTWSAWCLSLRTKCVKGVKRGQRYSYWGETQSSNKEGSKARSASLERHHKAFREIQGIGLPNSITRAIRLWLQRAKKTFGKNWVSHSTHWHCTGYCHRIARRCLRAQSLKYFPSMQLGCSEWGGVDFLDGWNHR